MTASIWSPYPLGTPLSSDNVSYTSPMLGGVTRTATSKFSDIQSAKDVGVETGTTASQTASIMAGFSQGPLFFPPGNYRMDTPATGAYNAIMFGDVTFSGAGALDLGLPAFGTDLFRVIAGGNSNAIVGAIRNNTPTGTLAFPSGVTGYASVESAGGFGFALYGETALNTSRGVATSELSAFNNGGAPSSNLPPDRSFNTLQVHAIPVSITADGDYNCSIGAHWARGGQQQRSFLCGAAFDPNSCVNFAVWVGASATEGPTVPVFIGHRAATLGLQLQAYGTFAADNAVLQVVDTSAAVRFGVRQNGRLAFGTGISQTTVGAAGGASALPATPTKYIELIYDGSTVGVFPVYAKT